MTIQHVPAPTVDEYRAHIVRELLAQSRMSVNEAWHQVHRFDAVIERRYTQNTHARYVAGAIAYSARAKETA